MSYANEHIQIYLNKSPYLKKEAADIYSTPNQHRPYDSYNMLNFLPNKFPQSNLYSDEIDPSLDSNYHKIPQTSNLVQRKLAFNSSMSYPSSQSFDLYAGEDETLEAFKDAEYSPLIDNEDQPDSLLSSQSKRIRKEGFKSNSSKKNSQMKVKTKRNPWQPEEDEQVVELVAKYGQSWALIASLMKGRSGKQIRDRYLNKLKPDINKAEWTPKEDELVMSLCKEMGHKWSKIATYLPGRTEGQVKNRFYSHIKKRMGKWMSQSNYQRTMEEDGDSEQESQNLKDLLNNEPLNEGNVRNSIQTLNCVGEYKIVNSMEESVRIPKLSTSSINIKLNTFDPKENTQGKKGFTYNLVSAEKNTSAKDPTDVISYVGKEASPDKSESPFSQKSTIQLASTRSSSLSQEKEFEEVIDKMATSMVKQPTKLHGISFSISNGTIIPSSTKTVANIPSLAQSSEPVKKVTTTGGAMLVKNLKEVNQLSFSGVQNMINIRIC